MMTNRNDFNWCAVLVFDLLYKGFPKEIDVVIDDFVDPFDEKMTDNYLATIRFLQREGLIRYQELHYSTFKGVVLSAKGLKILDTILEEKTIAQQMSDALAEANQKAIETLVLEVVKLATKN